MLNSLVSILDNVAGLAATGVLALYLDHPVVLCVIISGLAGGAYAILLDIAAEWVSGAS